MRATDELGAAFAPVEDDVQLPRHVAEVVQQRRRLGIERREDPRYG